MHFVHACTARPAYALTSLLAACTACGTYVACTEECAVRVRRGSSSKGPSGPGQPHSSLLLGWYELSTDVPVMPICNAAYNLLVYTQ
jgi:hypothetical protein